MPLLVTPRRLTQRAEFYHQLAALTSAGVGLLSALGMVHNAPPNRAYQKPLAQLVQEIERGSTFTDALRATTSAGLPAFDVALIQAGEQSGRLDACFRLLADYYNERAVLARQVLSDLAYPALLLHLAILLFPITLLTGLVVRGDWLGFILAKSLVLAPLYGVTLLILASNQDQRGEPWRAGMERLLHTVPGLGAARLNLALARLSAALESLLSAGVSIIEAWPLAAAASGSPALRQAVTAWTSNVQAGQTPAEAVRQSQAFPELFVNLYSTGEISGQLDETLQRLHRHYQEEATRKLHAFAQWTPRLVYFGVMLLIAYQVFSFWSGYFTQINSLAL
jgi:type II secretory pathway component PulF